ncbi:MAG: DUF5011 domain-containing protein [Clostridiales bacterium]|nr:DUF5011 domain-containing protein [Clostridiales bacterium]
MAVRKKATKSTKKAELNYDFSEVKLKNKTKSSAKTALKNTSAKVFLFAFLFLIVGAVLGAGAWWFVCRNDCFELVGEETVSITLGESYKDEGVEIVSFGKDVEPLVMIETNLKQNVDGEYYADEIGTFYIKYYSTDFKYGKLFKVEKVRLVDVVEASEGGE